MRPQLTDLTNEAISTFDMSGGRKQAQLPEDVRSMEGLDACLQEAGARGADLLLARALQARSDPRFAQH